MSNLVKNVVYGTLALVAMIPLTILVIIVAFLDFHTKGDDECLGL